MSRRPAQAGVRHAIWATHSVVNAAVAYYEEHLLTMRGASYSSAERQFTAEEISEKQLRLAREAQVRNGHSQDATDEEIGQLLRKLYEQIVPSAVGESGSAQNANAFLSLLTDPNSRGFMSIFDKLATVPPWVESFRSGNTSAVADAIAWLSSDAGRARYRATGAPPRWVRLARQSDPQWPAAFIDDFDKKREKVAGAPAIVRRLKELGVLPLFATYLAPRIERSQGVVSPWDRLVFRLAVGHLMSWESWCRLAAKEHEACTTRIAQFEQRYVSDDLRQSLEALRRYETERTSELDQIAGALGKTEFRITLRMVRGWSDLRDKWIKLNRPTADRLRSIAAAEQTRQRERFGDPHLFLWLTRSENHHIWNNINVDPVTVLARLNAMTALRDRSRPTATYTPPDPRVHPRSAQWEATGGSNLKTYRLSLSGAGSLKLDLPLLTPSNEHQDRYVESSYSLALAPSGQLPDTTLSVQGKSTRIAFRGATGESIEGVLGSGDLMLNWTFLRNRDIARVAAGDIGPVYFKLALDLDPILPAGWNGRRPQALFHFRTSLAKKSKYENYLASGLRVLSVDLGLRSFATCSVFELKSERPERGLFFDLPGANFWAQHERSFTLNLPDERVGPEGKRWQSQAHIELLNLRRTLTRYRNLYRAVALAPEERIQYLESLLADAAYSDTWPFEALLLHDLNAYSAVPAPLWEGQIAQALARFRAQFGPIVSGWRHRTRQRSHQRTKYFGRSMWALDYLSLVRRFLQSWSLLGRTSGEIRRLDRQRGGVFASRLLEHLNNVKEDRLKTGADLLIQAARGYLRDSNGAWHQRYKPCHAILFEDLTRYRMRTDRPRRENSQLMKWAHRSIPKEVVMQGELYGIYCEETAAAFSSRYHAASGAPGVRCHSLTLEDFKDLSFREILERNNPGLSLEDYRIGDLVPLPGGELFACCSRDGVVRVHADINAAQNLQRRFWTRHADPFRIVARKPRGDSREIWLPQHLGPRLRGGLGDYGYLVPTGHDSGSCRWQPVKPARWKRLVTSSELDEVNGDSPGDEVGDFASIEEDLLEESGIVRVFFRDPSGIVLPADLWYPSATFWSIVKNKTAAALRPSALDVIR